jgi:hypothetical protein
VVHTTDTRLIYAVVGDTSLVQLLVSTPIPVQGIQGIKGDTGDVGPQGPVLMYAGNWVAHIEYDLGSIVAANNALYLANVRNVDNFPPSNPFWTLLGALAVQQSEIVVACDGAGQIIVTGFKGYITIPHNCVLNSWTLLADQVGSASFNVKWSTFAGLPSTVSFVGGSGPTLATAQKAENDVSGWSPVTFNAGDVLEFDLTSVSDCTFLTLALQISSTN